MMPRDEDTRPRCTSMDTEPLDLSKPSKLETTEPILRQPSTAPLSHQHTLPLDGAAESLPETQAESSGFESERTGNSGEFNPWKFGLVRIPPELRAELLRADLPYLQLTHPDPSEAPPVVAEHAIPARQNFIHEPPVIVDPLAELPVTGTAEASPRTTTRRTIPVLKLPKAKRLHVGLAAGAALLLLGVAAYVFRTPHGTALRDPDDSSQGLTHARHGQLEPRTESATSAPNHSSMAPAPAGSPPAMSALTPPAMSSGVNGATAPLAEAKRTRRGPSSERVRRAAPEPRTKENLQEPQTAATESADSAPAPAPREEQPWKLMLQPQ